MAERNEQETAEDGLVEEESVHLSDFLAQLKAKYCLEPGLGDGLMQGTPELGAAPAGGGAARSPPAPADSPPPQPAHAEEQQLWQLSPHSSPSAAPGDSEPAPAPTSAAAAAATPPAPPRAAEPEGSSDVLDDEADLRQLLQLEALEEQLAQQAWLAAEREGAASPLCGATPPAATANLTSSLPSATATSSSDWSDLRAAGPAPLYSSTSFGAEAPAGSAGAGGGWGEQLPWALLSQQLAAAGFPGIGAGAGSQPEPGALYAALSSVLAECERRGRHAQQLGEAAQAAARREDALLRRFQAAAGEKEVEAAKWKRLALQVCAGHY